MGRRVRTSTLKYFAQDNQGEVKRLEALQEAILALKIEAITLTPPNKKQLKNLFGYVAGGKVLNIVSTVCPDYSSENGRYTFENLGEGVSMLPRMHLAVAGKILPLLAEFGIGFRYFMLIADLAEGTDEVVVAKFCNGRIEEFLRRCECTRQALEELVWETLSADVAAQTTIGTFDSFYGERYNTVQAEFTDLVLRKKKEDGSFGQSFVATHAKRIPLYRMFLRGYIDDPTAEQLEYRTARGIAQYLAHFTLLRLEVPQVVMLNHRTINLQYVNRVDLARNEKERGLLSEKPKIPVFVIENPIY